MWNSTTPPLVSTGLLTALAVLAVAAPSLVEAGKKKKAEAMLAPSGATTSAEDIPELAELLHKAGWVATPEMTGAFQAGLIFRPTEHGHSPLISDCFEAEPNSSTYTSSEVVSQLQTGVGMRFGGARVEATGGMIKKVKFGTPTHITLDELSLVPTDDCRSKIERAQGQGMDLSQAYVIQQVLMAQISEQTCGQIDASGRFIAVGQAEVQYSQACAQFSLEPVAVAFRTLPLATVLGDGIVLPPAAPTATGDTEVLLDGDEVDFGALAAAAAAKQAERERLEAVARLDAERRAEAEARRAAQLEAERQRVASEEAALAAALDKERTRRLEDAKAALVAKAEKDWQAIQPMARAPVTDEARPVLEAFLDRYGDAKVRIDDVDYPVVVPGVRELRMALQPVSPGLQEAIAHATGSGRPVDFPKAIAAFQSICDDGDPIACSHLAFFHHTGRATPVDKARARALQSQSQAKLTELCAGDDWAACSRQAFGMRYGYGTDHDEAAALQLYTDACAQGEVSACMGQAVMILLGQGRRADPDEALAVYQATCDSGHLPACRGIGTIYVTDSWGVPKDLATARRWLTPACERKDPIACHWLGKSSTDLTQALALHEQSCEGDYAKGCNTAGILHRDGVAGQHGAASTARLRFTKSCTLGSGYGCFNLARLYESDPRLQARDDPSAKALYARGCKLGHSASCSLK